MRSKCTVSGCDRQMFGRGLCNAHYQRVTKLGALNPEVPIKKQGKHGLHKHSMYNIWQGIIRRCENQKCKAYPRYGGRGITVCERWHTLENFIEDMEPRPAGMSIERIDNNSNYEPSNCRWSSAKEQANNTRSNRRLTLNGETRTLSGWAEKLGLAVGTISSRLNRDGWPIEKVLTALPTSRQTLHDNHGESP